MNRLSPPKPRLTEMQYVKLLGQRHMAGNFAPRVAGFRVRGAVLGIPITKAAGQVCPENRAVRLASDLLEQGLYLTARPRLAIVTNAGDSVCWRSTNRKPRGATGSAAPLFITLYHPSNRSRSITFPQARTKSATNFAPLSAWA